MDVYLIRHGEMVYERAEGIDVDLINAYANGTRQGPLTEKGRGQAGDAAVRLSGLNLQALYSSAFIRAQQTAEEASRLLDLPVEVIPDCGEIRVGHLAPDQYPDQGRFLALLGALMRISKAVPGDGRGSGVVGYLLVLYLFNRWYRGRTLGGESFDDAKIRISGAFQHIVEKHRPHDRVALFTHGYFIHLLVNVIIDPKGAAFRFIKKPYIKNGSITHLAGAINGPWTVESFSDAAHLDLKHL